MEWFRKLFPKKVPEKWEYVGCLDTSVSGTSNGGKKRNFEVRSLLFISNKGNRKVTYNFETLIEWLGRQNSYHTSI